MHDDTKSSETRADIRARSPISPYAAGLLLLVAALFTTGITGDAFHPSPFASGVFMFAVLGAVYSFMSMRRTALFFAWSVFIVCFLFPVLRLADIHFATTDTRFRPNLLMLFGHIALYGGGLSALLAYVAIRSLRCQSKLASNDSNPVPPEDSKPTIPPTMPESDAPMTEHEKTLNVAKALDEKQSSQNDRNA